MRKDTLPHFLPMAKPDATEYKGKVLSLTGLDTTHEYSEGWLQELIHNNPKLVPAAQIEPIFENLIPVCRELPCPSGFLDNLYVTPDGYLCLVECKLWRNPEGRRKVIAQIIDYAKDFANWDYDDLSNAINQRNKTRDENPLYSIAAEHPDAIDEIRFVDRVSENLMQGRHLLLILGDGIQENIENMAEYLQRFMGLNFTLGLVEMNIYQMDKPKGLIVIPSIPAKTVNITRATIKLADSGMTIIEEKPPIKDTEPSARPQSLSEESFFEELSSVNPEWRLWLKRFLIRLENIGITYDIKRTLVLRYSPDGETEFGLGYFTTKGQYDSRNATWKLDQIGHLDVGVKFVKNLTEIFPNASIREFDTSSSKVLTIKGNPPLISDLAAHEQEFYGALERFIFAIREIIKQ